MLNRFGEFAGRVVAGLRGWAFSVRGQGDLHWVRMVKIQVRWNAFRGFSWVGVCYYGSVV